MSGIKRKRKPLTPTREKIASLAELEKRGLCIIDEDVELENSLDKILKEKRLPVSDLARMTGLSRQNINAVVKNKMKPGVDFALKVSYVLNTPIEELFHLTDSAWIKPHKQDQDQTQYLDIINLEIINNTAKYERIKGTAENPKPESEWYEYYCKEKQKFLTKPERDAIIKQYVDKNFEAKLTQLQNDENNNDLSGNQLKSLAIEELKAEIDQKIVKIYRKLGERIRPYVIK